jgi:hypothetical protein
MAEEELYRTGEGIKVGRDGEGKNEEREKGRQGLVELIKGNGREGHNQRRRINVNRMGREDVTIRRIKGKEKGAKTREAELKGK